MSDSQVTLLTEHFHIPESHHQGTMNTWSKYPNRWHILTYDSWAQCPLSLKTLTKVKKNKKKILARHQSWLYPASNLLSCLSSIGCKSCLLLTAPHDQLKVAKKINFSYTCLCKNQHIKAASPSTFTDVGADLVTASFLQCLSTQTCRSLQ